MNNKLPHLPKINKNKLVICINKDKLRDPNFLSSLKKPRNIYILSILLHNEIVQMKKNNSIQLPISELQKIYKIFRGESQENIIQFLEELNKDFFKYYNLDLKDRILYYNIEQSFFNIEEHNIFINICLLKNLKINSQKIILYLFSLGKHAKYLNLYFIANITNEDINDLKKATRMAKVIFNTLLKNNFIKSYFFDRNKKTFYIKMGDIKTKEFNLSLPDKIF